MPGTEKTPVSLLSNSLADIREAIKIASRIGISDYVLHVPERFVKRNQVITTLVEVVTTPAPKSQLTLTFIGLKMAAKAIEAAKELLGDEGEVSDERMKEIAPRRRTPGRTKPPRSPSSADLESTEGLDSSIAGSPVGEPLVPPQEEG
jgi:hypothetical protein